MTSEQETVEESVRLPMAPGGIVQAAVDELARLTVFVQQLALEDWSKPSAVAAWTIGDVVAHLNLTLSLYTRLVGAVVSGKGAGSAWKAVSRLTAKAMPAGAPVFNTLNSAIPRVVGKALAPEVVRGQFEASARRFGEKLAQIGPSDYTRPVHYLGTPWPLSFFLAATVNEMAVHGWDMASPLDRAAHLSAGARSILPWFYWGATSWMFHRPADLAGSVQAQLTDPDASMWWSVTATGTERGTGERDLRNDVMLRGESGMFVLVLAGRIAAGDALRTTSLTAEGDAATAERFLGAWKIV
ncbi:MAG TPA: maleylpyruvate isomerase N-terminal domain-containing protein [Chloroflexota bacterium]|nr:maleylpyruvate isomerase N-terminal domain-containing protein [Chloroflexota bacterium]